MRITLPLIVLAALAAEGLAQTPALNTFEVYSGRTSFTSRGFLSRNAGETLQGYPGEQFRGIGDVGDVPKECRIHAFGMIAQDQNQRTVEKYKVVFRGTSDSETDPDGSLEGVIFKSGSLSLPTGTGTGPAAWSITINFGKDGIEVPCKHTYFAGVELSANANWTADGQSTHASAYTTPSSTSGDPVRSGAISHAWQVDAAGATRKTNPRAWRYNLKTQRGVFQLGCIQASSTTGRYGFCGVYPDPKTHGMSFRLRDADQKNNKGVVFISTSLIGGAPLPFDGTLWINPGTLVMIGGGTLNASGVLEIKPPEWAPGKLKDFEGVGNVAFQAAIEDVGNGRFNIRTSNAQAANF